MTEKYFFPKSAYKTLTYYHLPMASDRMFLFLFWFWELQEFLVRLGFSLLLSILYLYCEYLGMNARSYLFIAGYSVSSQPDICNAAFNSWPNATLYYINILRRDDTNFDFYHYTQKCLIFASWARSTTIARLQKSKEKIENVKAGIFLAFICWPSTSHGQLRIVWGCTVGNFRKKCSIWKFQFLLKN